MAFAVSLAGVAARRGVLIRGGAALRWEPPRGQVGLSSTGLGVSIANKTKTTTLPVAKSSSCKKGRSRSVYLFGNVQELTFSASVRVFLSTDTQERNGVF